MSRRMSTVWTQMKIALCVLFAVLLLPCLEGSLGSVQAEEVEPYGALLRAVASCNNGGTQEVQLTGDINVTSTIALTGGELTLDLNGYAITGAIASGAIFQVSGTNTKLTIMDSSKGKGSIKNSDANGYVINVNGGSLVIQGGNLQSSCICLKVTNTENTDITESNIGPKTSVSLSGGSLNGILSALEIGKNSTITISDTAVLSSDGEAVRMATQTGGSTVTITGGTLNGGKVNGDLGYACNFSGADNELKITGGTFNLNAVNGSSLVIGGSATDANVTISGGTFNGRIGRATDTEHLNYTAYYGDGNGSGSHTGIIASGYVLTDNAVYYDKENVGENIEFTRTPVSVVPGTLIRLNTRRSQLEEYSENEKTEANNADLYELPPVSVGKDGTIYSNTGSTNIPVLDPTRITDGNTYTFSGWRDASGQEYASITAEMAKSGITNLDANYKAAVTTEAGLKKALNYCDAVKEIELKNDIQLSSQTGGTSNLSLNGKTITYASGTNPAFVMNGTWNIENGTIISEGQACIQINGTAELENLKCVAKNFNYAVDFRNVTASSQSRILSGTFEATGTGGCALRVTHTIGEAGSAEDITNLLQGVFPSTTAARIDGSDVYLNAPRLVVYKTQEIVGASGSRSMIGGMAYKLGAGRWTVSGDNTVYNGAMNFYVPADGQFYFQKK